MIDITKRINTPAIYEDILYIKDLIQLATPRKVIYNNYGYNRYSYNCPNCNEEIMPDLVERSSFCCKCGQRIYWE